MKTKRTLTIATLILGLAVLIALGIVSENRRVNAQDTIPPPIPERISFGMVGITQGQTVRLSVVNTNPPPQPDSQPQTQRVVLTFLDAAGNHLRQRDGTVIRRAMQLQPAQAVFLDLNYDEYPPGPTRLQLRAVVTVQPPPTDGSNNPPPVNDRIATTVEVFNNANGRTAFAIAAAPSVQRLQPPPVPEGQ